MFSQGITKTLFNHNYSGGTIGTVGFLSMSGSSGGSSSSGGGGGGSSGGGTGGSPLALYYYSQLAFLVTTISDLLYNYSLGNMAYVTANLTKTKYWNLSVDLTKLKQDASIFPEFENIRLSVARALEGLYKSVLQYQTCSDTKIQLEIMTEKESILHDMDKLKKYIEQLSGSMSLFPDIEISSIAATLKPEIAEYIRLFGLPEAGVFETEKLAIAIRNVSGIVC